MKNILQIVINVMILFVFSINAQTIAQLGDGTLGLAVVETQAGDTFH